MTTMILKLKEVVTANKDNVKASKKFSNRARKRFAAGTSMEGFSYAAAMVPFKIIGL
ncbi:MAG: hypothetical protein GX197_10775 [Firmicutes bacterium]|nr:hypothetical protein [Bacillota bacterium]